MALDKIGNVYVWGSNVTGKLGIGEDGVEFILEPRHIDSFNGERVVKIVCGGEHSVALTDRGDIWAWGNGEFGQLSRYTNLKNAIFPIKLPSVTFDNNMNNNIENSEVEKTRVGHISAKHIWDVAYQHEVTDIMCGSSFTVLQLTSSIKEEVKEVLMDPSKFESRISKIRKLEKMQKQVNRIQFLRKKQEELIEEIGKLKEKRKEKNQQQQQQQQHQKKIKNRIKVTLFTKKRIPKQLKEVKSNT